jgi:hypothetical protein
MSSIQDKRAKGRALQVHTVVVPVRVTLAQTEQVQAQAEMLGGLYNAGLGTMKGRVHQIRRNQEWRSLGEWTPKDKTEQAQRAAAYQALKNEYKLTEYDCINVVAKHLRESKWIPDHINAATCQEVAKNLWKSVNAWIYNKAGEPHYKPIAQTTSVPGRDSTSGLRYKPGQDNKAGQVIQRTRRMQQSKGPLQDKALVAETDWSEKSKGYRKYYLARQDLIRQTKLVLVTPPGKKTAKVEAHLTYDCLPYRSETYYDDLASEGTISMDFGPSGASWVDDQGNHGFMFAPEDLLREQKRLKGKRKALEQSMNRSRREMNKECYEQDTKGKHTKGRSIKGKKHTARSKAQERRSILLQKLFNEEKKRLDEYHRAVIHRIIKQANYLITEHDRFEEWKQQGYGKSIQTIATGALKDSLLREFTLFQTGAHEHDPYITKLSSYCLCGTKASKPVYERVHCCQNQACKLYNTPLHRDLFSAFLGLLVKQYGISKLVKGKLLTEHWFTALETCMVSRGSKVVTSEVDTHHQELVTGPVIEDVQSRHPVAGREEQYQEDSSQLCKVSRGDQGSNNTDPRSVSRPERSADTQFISQDRSREVHEAQQDRTDKQRECITHTVREHLCNNPQQLRSFIEYFGKNVQVFDF